MTQPGADPLARTLPAERTVLAWTRTSFAFLVNGALLTIKDFHGHHGSAGFILAAIAVAVAMGTYLIALQRQRILQRHPIPKEITPRRSVYIIGISTIVLIAATTVALLL